MTHEYILDRSGDHRCLLDRPVVTLSGETRFQLFKTEWEHWHDDYCREVGYESLDPDSKLYYARDRHASLARYFGWECKRLTLAIKTFFKRKQKRAPDQA